MKIGICDDEQKMVESGSAVVRIHKSYLVNLMNVREIENQVIFMEDFIRFPVGRKYKDAARKLYFEYGKDKVRKRLWHYYVTWLRNF